MKEIRGRPKETGTVFEHSSRLSTGQFFGKPLISQVDCPTRDQSGNNIWLTYHPQTGLLGDVSLLKGGDGIPKCDLKNPSSMGRLKNFRAYPKIAFVLLYGAVSVITFIYHSPAVLGAWG